MTTHYSIIFLYFFHASYNLRKKDESDTNSFICKNLESDLETYT